MTASIELTVEQRGGDVTLLPFKIVDTVDLGIVQAPALAIEITGGAPGARGERGPGGREPVTFHFSEPKATWMCPHDLHYIPTVTVVDGDGQGVWPSIFYDSTDLVRLEFGRPFTGKAIFS